MNFCAFVALITALCAASTDHVPPLLPLIKTNSDSDDGNTGHTLLHPSVASRLELHPELKFEAQYEGESENGELIFATMNFNAKIPTINLNNQKGISNIYCDDKSVKVKFDNREILHAAYFLWSSEPELAIMIHSCDNNNVSKTFTVDKVNSYDDEALVFDAKEIKSHDLYNTVELTLRKSPSNASERIETSWEHAFGANYDMQSQRVLQPSIDMYKSSAGSLECRNCHATGKLSVSITLMKEETSFTGYQFIFDGELFANMDFVFKKYAAERRMWVKTLLFYHIFGAVGVPGMFTFIPSLLLHTELSLDVLVDLEVSYGFDMTIPFKYELSADSIRSKPTFHSFGKPKLKEHQFKVTKNLGLTTAAHIMPSIDIKLALFETVNLKWNLALDSQLIVDVRGGDLRTSKCKDRAALEIALFHEYDIEFSASAIESKIYRLYDSGKMEIECIFCSTCMNPDKVELVESETTALLEPSASP